MLRKYNYGWLGICLVMVMLSACKPDQTIDDLFSDIPEIELIQVSPMQVIAFRDSINFDIRYTDGNGDLGSSNAEDKNLFIVDERIDVTHTFRLPNIVPNGEQVPISGTVTISLPNTIITDNSSSQEVTFTLYLVDKAGNESNRVSTPPITVVE